MFFIFDKGDGLAILFLIVYFVDFIQAGILPTNEIDPTQLPSHVIVKRISRFDSGYYSGALITRKTILTSGYCTFGRKIASQLHIIIGKEVVDRNFDDENSLKIDEIVTHEKYENDNIKYNIGLLISNNNLINDKTHLAKIKRSSFNMKAGTLVNFDIYNAHGDASIKLFANTVKIEKCDDKRDGYSYRTMCVTKPVFEDYERCVSIGNPIYLAGKSKPIVNGILYEQITRSEINYVFAIQTGARGIYNWIKKHQKK